MITWNGEGADNNWSTGDNWVGGSAPGATDLGVFDGTTGSNPDKDCTIDVASIGGIQTYADYSGTITQGTTLTMGMYGFIQGGGTFTGATQNITVNNTMYVTGGTFTSTTGYLDLNGGLTVGSGGTFNHNNGEVRFTATSDKTVDVDTSLTLYDVLISTSSSSVSVDLSSGDTIVASNSLTLTNGQLNGGTIESGSVTFGNFDGGTGIVHITGTNVHSFDLDLLGGQTFCGLTSDNPNVTITGSGTISAFEGDVTLNAGTIAAAATSWYFESVTINGGTLTAAPTTRVHGDWTFSSGTFNHNSSTFVFAEDDSDNQHTISGNSTFNDIQVDIDSTLYDAPGFLFEAGSTTTILGDTLITLAQLDEVTDGVRIDMHSTSAGTAANINFGGEANLYHVDLQDINNTGASFDCNIRCADSGGNTNISFDNLIGFHVSEISGETTEAGGTATFTVVLTGKPTENVSIPVASSDSGEGTASTSSLTFTSANWETPQTVTVTGQDDSEDDGTIDYTITLGTTSSSDSRYDALNPSDVSVSNQDDDVSTTAIQFDYLGNFDVEDVSATTGTDLGAFVSDTGKNGLGFLYDDDTSLNDINVLSTKIQPGCIFTYEGTDYNLTQLVAEGDFSYDAILSQEHGNSEDIGTILDALGDHDIESITCLESEGGELKLNDATITTDLYDLSGTPHEILYESGNNLIYVPDKWGSTVDVFNPSTGTFVTATVGSQPLGLAYDSTRDHIWVANTDDGTITALEAADGSYAFGNLGASTFTTDSDPERIVYDSTNDKLWVNHTYDGDIWQFDPADGSHDDTLTVSSSQVVADLAYDSTNDSVWALMDGYVVEIDGVTGTFKTGSVTTSTYAIPMVGDQTSTITYDVTRDVLWVIDEIGESTPDEMGLINRVRASDGVAIATYVIGEKPIDVQINSADGEVWVNTNMDNAMSIIDPSNGRFKSMPATADDPGMTTIDSNGDLWGIDGNSGKFIHVIPGGVPADYYYTISSNTTSDLDVSAVGSIDAVTVNETLNSQNIYYTVSFDDGDSYKVWGSWRTIASNKNSDHGGVEGNWYYRDNANTWAAATPNDKNAAISAAVAEGANNQMDSTTLAGLSSADWAVSGGFQSGTTSNLNLAATLYTDDAHTSPSLESVDFTFTASTSTSSSDEPISVSNQDIDTQTCSATPTTTVLLSGSNIADYLLSEDPDFINDDWQAFVPNVESTTVGENGETIQYMQVPFTLSAEDGEKTVYAKFRSATHNQTTTLSDGIILDQAGGCTDVVEEEPEEIPYVTGCMGIVQPAVPESEKNEYRFGVSPMSGLYSSAEMVRAGDVIRGKSFDTVYCIDEELNRRPFMDEVSYFTHLRSFEVVRWVEDDALADFPLQSPVLPNPEISLVKFESSDKVYLQTADSSGDRLTHLAWITTEEIARSIAGDDWADYVIDLNPTLVKYFVYDDPITTTNGYDITQFRKRQLLNEDSASLGNADISLQVTVSAMKTKNIMLLGVQELMEKLRRFRLK